MKTFDKLILVLALVASILAAIVFLPVLNPDLSSSLGSGAATFIGGLWFAVKVVFVVAIGLVITFAVFKFKQMNSTQVIIDQKDGRPVRAVVHKGQLVQIAPGGMDITEIMKLQAQQVAQMQNYWKLFSTATASMKNMAAFMDQYEVVDADDQDEIETAQAAKQIDAPRSGIITVHLSDDCTIPADDLLSGRKLICGTSGSGKSNTVGSYGEELGRLRVPFVMGDTEDEYQPLCNQLWLPNGVRAGLSGPYKVTVENAAKFGAYVLDHRLQVILNLHSYEMEEAALVMIGIINGMREWEEQFENEDRIPCDFILEEAVTWLPQNIKESPLYGTNTFNMLQSTFFNDMVRKGRKRGLGLTLVCQKIAELDKRAMQSDGKLLHRQTEPNDLDRYAKFGIPKENTLSLADGECFLFTSHISGQRVQIRRRHSPHGAKTPGIANLRKTQKSDIGESPNSPIDAHFSVNLTGPEKNTGPLSPDDEMDPNQLETGSPMLSMQSPDKEFVAGPDDRVFTPEQEQEFVTRYKKQNLPVKAILRQMNNGQGLSNRYSKHAGWIIEHYELRKET